MKQTKGKSQSLNNGTKISLSVRIEADSDRFSENEQQEIISVFGLIAQLLLSELENTIGYRKCKAKLSDVDGKALTERFGLSSSTDFVVFDSKDLAREFVALSFYLYNTPMQLIIDYDPDYPYGVLEKRFFKNQEKGYFHSADGTFE